MELAINELKFLPRELLMENDNEETSLHPLVRLVPFDHSPEPLLTALASMQLPGQEEETGEYWLMLDHREEELSFRALPHKSGAAAG